MPAGCLAILLCVPDAEIEAAAATVAGAAPFVGHTSGATPLSALAPAARAGAQTFGLHPLQTFAGDAGSPDLAGVGAAVAGSTPDALEVAEYLARRLGMRPFVISDEERAAYHAAASMASNFLVTLEAAAERVAGGAGLEPHEARALLLPLVRRTVENWGALGPEEALTGPVARGDEATVEAQRSAVAETAPELLLALRRAGGRHSRPCRAPGGGMNVVRTVAELRAALASERRAGRTIGLVPTMGSFHEGHLSLMRRAREECRCRGGLPVREPGSVRPG